MLDPSHAWYLYALLGLVIGTLAGLLGIGGGVLVIPALVFLFGFPQRIAVGTSLAMLLPPIGIFAILPYWRAGNVSVGAAAWLAAGFAVGGFVGGWLANSGVLSERLLRVTFALFMLYVAGNMLFRSENRVAAALKTGLLMLGFAAVYAGARLLGRRLERRMEMTEEYRKRLGAPLAPDYEI
ncbi:MAG: TSUP family transporter [Phycisphaerae bacterium]|nr:TSUP family transporter [Tepidisphaeraceae bacterium]